MENVSEKLFNLLGTKFNNTDIKTLTSTGRETREMEEIKMFSFDFMMDDKNYGPVVILISTDENLEVYYGDNTSKSLDRDAKKKWENLIEHLSTFARSNRLGFSLKHTTDLKYDLSNIADIADLSESFKNIFESYYGTSKTSYNRQGKAKIIIKHSKRLGEDDKRFRYISQLFIENAEGERFKLPFTKLTGARAMARHVTEGGNPYDLFGVHICEMVKDINTLGGFVRRSKMFEDDEATSGLVETGRTHYTSLRKGLKQIAGKRGYHTFKENWEPSEITTLDEDTDAIRKLFTERSLNEKVSNALPLLVRLQRMAENSSAEGEWNSAMGYDGDDTDEMIGGPDECEACNATGMYRGAYCKACDGSGIAEAADSEDHRRNTNPLSNHPEIPWPVEVKGTGQFPGDWHPDQDDWMDDDDDDPHPYNMPETKEFESWANEMVEGTWAVPETTDQVEELKQFLSTEQSLGIDAMNVTDLLYNVIGDDDLFDSLDDAAEQDPDQDARPIVIRWIRNAIANLEFVDPNVIKNLTTAISGIQEGLNTELDADSPEKLTASINKDMDKHVREDDDTKCVHCHRTGTVEKDPAGEESYCTVCGKTQPEDLEEITQFNETESNMTKLFTEYVTEVEEKTEWKKPWEDDGEVTDSDDKKDVDEGCDDDKDEVKEENTIEVKEPSGPIVTMENDDLANLMQRTNHLLKKY